MISQRFPKFRNRIEAAGRLLPYLEKYRKDDGVIMAIPRGSVPMAFHIARHLHFPLDILMAKKIGFPGNSEFAVGSVSLGGRVLDPRLDVDPDYINLETARIRKALSDQYALFSGGQQSVSLKGKTVILVDDGIATGYTLLEAVQTVRSQNPRKIVIAVPVAPLRAVDFFRSRVDEIICLHQPSDFHAVGQFYEDFPQVSDEEVVHLMQEAHALV